MLKNGKHIHHFCVIYSTHPVKIAIHLKHIKKYGFKFSHFYAVVRGNTSRLLWA